ncbi:hypothetical protein QCA50_007560 [Cerrena zonata]|uniref:Cytochrome P450 n=1 Tax=Cerrena zonata TaxID=2478898 RepID=A0AAW0GIR1_9APHY
MSYSLSSVFIFLASLAIVLIRKRNVNSKGHPLPPGPPPLPVVGNLFDLPRTSPWLTFAALSRKYGDVIHLKALNQSIIVVSSLEAATDLFEKRATIYSDRYQSVMLTDLIQVGWSFPFLNYGEKWRKNRKVFHQYLGSHAVRKYDHKQSNQVREFLRRLRLEPDQFFEHAHLLLAAIMMDIIYGIQITDVTNKHVQEAEAWGQSINQALEPGRFWVDFMPFLKYVPQWFPGAHFKRLVADWRQSMHNSRDGPFSEAKSAHYNNGSTSSSVVTTALDDILEDPQRLEKELTIRDSVGTAFVAGVDTSAPTLQLFFFAMMSHPDVQKKAQAELDIVVGAERLPTLNDRDNLPFVQAILKETLRWIPVAPLGVPHYTSTDDIYRGYHIPKGSVVIGSVWQILHDPDQYPEPERFKPERYLSSDGSLNLDIQDPGVACFGFGRRICPGKYLAENTLFLAIACTLHLFDIKPAKGPNGESLTTELRMHDNFVPQPKAFPCSIVLRPGAEELIT